MKPVEWFTQTPKNWAPFGNLLGFIAVFVALPVGLLSILNNILCLMSIDYLASYRDIGQTLFNGISVLGVLVAIGVFLRIQFNARANSGGERTG